MNALLHDQVAAVVQVEQMLLRVAGPFLAGNKIPVFPCVPGGKVPLTRHGMADATTDVAVAQEWWWRWPGANIGVPTGVTSGFDVVDVDVRETGSGYRMFRQAADRGGLDGWIMRVLTPSGGMHFYYPADAARPNRSWVTGAHVDFRGSGGAIIMTPSAGASRDGKAKRYRLVETRDTGQSVDGASLRDFLDPEQARRRLATHRSTFTGVLTGPREEALRRYVASRAEGERNAGLFWAACRVAETGQNVAAAVDLLGDPARQIGLTGNEITTTIRSAYRHTNPETGAPSGVMRPFQHVGRR